MKIKKILSVLTALLMLSLAACQNSANNIFEDDNNAEISSNYDEKNVAEKTVPQNTEEETNKLVVYRDPMLGDYIDVAVNIFKSEYPDVDLKYVDFSHLFPDVSDMTNYWDLYVNPLRTEFMAGGGPDIFIGRTYLFDDIYKTMETGFFYDLDLFLLDDVEFSFDRYNKTVLDAGVYKNKRCVIPLAYSVSIFLTSLETLNKENIDFMNVKSFDGFYKEIALYGEKYPNKRTFWQQFKGEMADMLLPRSGIDLYNFEAKKINVKNDNFKTVFEACKAIDSQPDFFNAMIYSGDSVIALKNGDYLFELFNYDIISSFLYDYGALLHDQTPLFSAVPSIDGKTNASSQVIAGIRNNSQNKINAYNFMKILLSDTVQSYLLFTSNRDIPVLKSALDVQIKTVLANQVAGTPDGSIIIEDIPQETIDEFTRLITEIDNCKLYHGNIMYYVVETMKPYVSGTSDYERCINELENKLELYMYE